LVVTLDLGTLVGYFWMILLVFLLLVPQIERSMLNDARRGLLKRIGKMRRSNVITLIHRQETIAFLSIPLSRYIDIDDSEEVLRAIRLTPKDAPIDLILHTPGGILLAASQIALALSGHPAKKTVIVPHYAMSGGTLIAFAADEIVMDPYAVLGPVDPQLMEGTASYPAVSVLKVLEKKKIDEINDRTIILADEAKKAMVQNEALVRKILAARYPDQTVNKVVDELVSGKYTHDNPITADLASAMGLKVSTQVPVEVYDLMRLYKMETTAKRPGVDFVPVMPGGPQGRGDQATK
jgi:ClpP class serine protease